MAEAILFCRQLALDALGCLFLTAGAAKLLRISTFREGLLYIPYMRPVFSYIIGFAVPPLELVTALGLFANAGWAKTSALVLLGCFLGVTLLVISKRLRVECHCFGGWGTRVFSVATAWEIVLLVVLAASSWGLSSRADPVFGISTAALLFLLYAALANTLRNAQLTARLRQ
jgi:hypothetical protein